MASSGDLKDAAEGPPEGPPLYPPGSTFFLAAGGLRRLRGGGEDFLGHPAAQMFWRDVLDLVHEEDLPGARDLVSRATEEPGLALNAGLRVRGASGGWTLVDARVRNVAEAPGDGGLVVAHFDDASPNNGYYRDGRHQNGHHGPQPAEPRGNPARSRGGPAWTPARQGCIPFVGVDPARPPPGRPD